METKSNIVISIVQFNNKDLTTTKMTQRERREKVPAFSMAIGKVELLLQRFPKYSRMGTARM